MKKISLLLAMAAMSLSSLASGFIYTYEGQTLAYNIVNQYQKTVSVTQYKPAPKGEGIIPPKVYQYPGIEYTVIEVEASAFKDCTELTSIQLPNTIKSIGSYAFYNCSSLTTANIPELVYEIQDYTFALSGLRSFDIPNNITKIGSHAFYSCSELRDINISNNVLEIGEVAFSKCSNLNSIVVPNQVTHIKYLAFIDDVNLKTVILGKNLYSLDVGLFHNCPKIEKVICLFTTPIEASDFFDYSVYDNATLVVPKGTRDEFAKVIPWKLFKNIVEEESTSVGEITLDTQSLGDIYTVGGTLVKQKPTDEDVKSLDPGLYIIGNKKILIR